MMSVQALADMKKQCEVQLASQREVHAAELAVLSQQVADAITKAEQADRTRATADDVVALKAALAVVHEEQRVRPNSCIRLHAARCHKGPVW